MKVRNVTFTLSNGDRVEYVRRNDVSGDKLRRWVVRVYAGRVCKTIETLLGPTGLSAVQLSKRIRNETGQPVTL